MIPSRDTLIKVSIALLFFILAAVFPGQGAAAAAPSITTRDGQALYTVQKGDTIYSIASRWGVSPQALIQTNGILDPSKLQIGQVLVIPGKGQTVGTPVPPVQGAGPVSPATNGPPALPTVSQPLPSMIPVTEQDIELLGRLVRAEAGGEPYEGMLAVAAVVVNRVKNSGFPNTIREVIYQPGQFQCVEIGTINQPATSMAMQAAREALSGKDPTGGALFFYNPAKSTAMSFWNTRKVVAVIGQHNFAR